MVTGASASGKTSLVRVLGGLWPSATGQIYRPAEVTDPKSRTPRLI